MRKPGSVESLEKLGRVRLSESFFMRDFLYSEIANFFGIPNIPDHPDVAIAAGTKLCEMVLEPLQQRFGRISIRSAYRSPTVNQRGIGRYNCASNEANYADSRSTSATIASPISVVPITVVPSDLMSAVRKPLSSVAAIALSIRSASLPMSNE